MGYSSVSTTVIPGHARLAWTRRDHSLTSFRDAPLGAGPESITTIGSMDSPMCNCTSEFDAARRPGMTGEKSRRAMPGCFGFEIVYPHGEEARRAVSNHEITIRVHPSRRGQEAAPQDEGTSEPATT